MTIHLSDFAAELEPPPPPMHIPRYNLDRAIDDIESTIRQLQVSQEVEWVSDAGASFRTEVYNAIQDVRAILTKARDASDAWSALQNAARANGQW